MGACALIAPVYLEIALFSGARSGARATGQVISAIDTAYISIHALREEGDGVACRLALAGVGISIHALREEGDTLLFGEACQNQRFLSTPSARRATSSNTKSAATIQEFLSTPSARRATRATPRTLPRILNFYPRPP